MEEPLCAFVRVRGRRYELFLDFRPERIFRLVATRGFFSRLQSPIQEVDGRISALQRAESRRRKLGYRACGHPECRGFDAVVPTTGHPINIRVFSGIRRDAELNEESRQAL